MVEPLQLTCFPSTRNIRYKENGPMFMVLFGPDASITDVTTTLSMATMLRTSQRWIELNDFVHTV
jgi:hypothetical protein